jgi:hypothetical protein
MALKGSNTASQDIGLVVSASVLIRALTLLVLFAAHVVVPTWDPEGRVFLQDSGSSLVLEPLVRWDTVHYARIALGGYAREQDFAFAPGLPFVMRLGSRLSTLSPGLVTPLSCAIVVGAAMAAVMSTVAAVLLYKCFLSLRTRSLPNLTLLFFQAFSPDLWPPRIRTSLSTPLHLSSSSTNFCRSLHRAVLRGLRLFRNASRISETVHHCCDRILSFRHI